MPEDGRTYPLLGQAKTLAHEADFRAWLSERGLTGRSLGDVVSRVRRVVDWLDVLASGTEAEALFRVTQDSRFMACTQNVQSQLKRAVLLYRKFSQARRGAS